MATGMKENDLSAKSPSDRSEDATDDFEVVSEANLYSIVSEYGSRGGDDEETERTVGKDEAPVIDPLFAFEMIHSEHRLLKDELDTQKEMLRQRLEAMEMQERRNAEEIATLKSNVESLTMELDEKKAQQSEMELQIKYFKESSEKADMLTAKLMEAEDVMKSQHEAIQQLKSDGYGGAPSPPIPVPSTDDSLRADNVKKDEQIKRLEGTLAMLESSLGAMNGERLKAKQEAETLADMNRELQVIINDLQSQAEADKAKSDMEKAEWDAIRSDLEQQVQVLSDRVLAFENQYSNNSMNQTEPTPAASAPPTSPQNSGTPILHHRDQAPRSQNRTGEPWVFCQRCHLPMATFAPHPCPAVIDTLD